MTDKQPVSVLDILLSALPAGYDVLKKGIRAEFVTLANGAIDGLMIGHVFRPHRPTEPLPANRTPLDRATLDRLRDSVTSTIVSRLLATVEQRDRIYMEIQTDADPAGTYRELIELRDLTSQLIAKIKELLAE
jgi:hypothetical protein